MRLMAAVLLCLCLACGMGVSCMQADRSDAGGNGPTSKEGLTEVWVKDGYPPADMPAPPGFEVTPWGAYHAVIKSKRLSLKHQWAWYRDDSSYYIFDTFGRSSSAKNAIRYGVKVNGLTGALE